MDNLLPLVLVLPARTDLVMTIPAVYWPIMSILSLVLLLIFALMSFKPIKDHSNDYRSEQWLITIAILVTGLGGFVNDLHIIACQITLHQTYIPIAYYLPPLSKLQPRIHSRTEPLHPSTKLAYQHSLRPAPFPAYVGFIDPILQSIQEDYPHYILPIHVLCFHCLHLDIATCQKPATQMALLEGPNNNVPAFSHLNVLYYEITTNTTTISMATKKETMDGYQQLPFIYNQDLSVLPFQDVVRVAIHSYFYTTCPYLEFCEYSGVVEPLHICLEIHPIYLYLKRLGHPYILRDPLLYPNSVRSIQDLDQTWLITFAILVTGLGGFVNDLHIIAYQIHLHPTCIPINYYFPPLSSLQTGIHSGTKPLHPSAELADQHHVRPTPFPANVGFADPTLQSTQEDYAQYIPPLHVFCFYYLQLDIHCIT